MKRSELIRRLTEAGCILHRHGANHDIYINQSSNAKAPVPRHSEIKNSLCTLIFKQLGIKKD